MLKHRRKQINKKHLWNICQNCDFSFLLNCIIAYINYKIFIDNKCSIPLTLFMVLQLWAIHANGMCNVNNASSLCSQNWPKGIFWCFMWMKCLLVLSSILSLSFLLCNYSTSECTESCQQTLTGDWLHAFMDAAQPLYHCYVSVLYIGQDQAYNVFTRDFNSCLHSTGSRPYSLLDKNWWSLSLAGLSPICLVCCILGASLPCGIFFM